MKRFGLLGHNIQYSKSPQLHNEFYKKHKIDATFDLIDVDYVDNFLLKKISNEYDGICITIPYKKTVFNLLKDAFLNVTFDESSSASGVCNVVTFNNDIVQGYNTDAKALKLIMKDRAINVQSALILGCGGAALSSCYVLRSLDVPVPLNSIYFNVRSFYSADVNQIDNDCPVFEYKDYVNNTRPFDVMINATPMGSGRADASALDIVMQNTPLSSLKLVVDWVYGDQDTDLILWAKQYEVPVVDGKELLKRQAEFAFSIWFNINIE